MSSRVQKGGPVFRPVAKPRARHGTTETTSRQPSVAADTRISVPPSAIPEELPLTSSSFPPPSTSMPPPVIVPVRITDPSPPPVSQPSKYGGVSSTPIATPSVRMSSEIRNPHVRPPERQDLSNSTVVEEQTNTQQEVTQEGTQSPKSDFTSKKVRKRSSSSQESLNSRKSRKSRAASVPYDLQADPGEDLDPTTVTMATLCDDTGQGRISSKAMQIQNSHLAWKTSSREKRARMRALMEAKKYGRDDENAETAQAQIIATPSEQPGTNSTPGPSTTNGSETATEDITGSGFDYTQSMATSKYNVQVRIGPNGETIIDETSLFVDRSVEDESANYTHVEESDTTKFVNSGTYGKRFRGSRWSAEETELFYDALSQFGENYELISYVLPGRDRKSCKNKFKAEDKKNTARITYCLNNRVPYDMQTLSRMTGKDFSGPTPEIRAPTVLTLAEPEAAPAEHSGRSVSPELPDMISKQSGTPALGDGSEEVLGDISSFE